MIDITSQHYGDNCEVGISSKRKRCDSCYTYRGTLCKRMLCEVNEANPTKPNKTDVSSRAPLAQLYQTELLSRARNLFFYNFIVINIILVDVFMM